MTKSGAVLALLLVAPACSKLEGKLQAKLEHYKTYTSDDYHFSVETPRDDLEEHFGMATLDGSIMTQSVTFNAPRSDGSIAVWVVPMPFAEGHKYTPQRIFDFEVGRLLRTIAGRITHQQDVTVDGVPGREIEATGNANAGMLSTLYLDYTASDHEKRDMPMSVSIRMFYRNATMYEAIGAYPTSASGTGTEAKRVVRSFKLIPLPALTPGVGEVSGLRCSPNFESDSHAAWTYLNPAFTVTLEKHLGPKDRIRVEAWCHVRDKDDPERGGLFGDVNHLDDKEMAELRQRGKVDASEPIGLWAVYEDPDICQLSFRVESGSFDRASLGDFCWTDAAVTKGRCGM